VRVILKETDTPHLNLLLQEESFRMNPARGEEIESHNIEVR